MIGNLQQPAKDWLADVVCNFAKQLKAGDDPSVSIHVANCEIEIRLNKIADVFNRIEFDLSKQNDSEPA